MMCHCRFINKCTSLVGDVNKGESYAGRQCVRISVPSTQFCHESNKTLKRLKKKKNLPCHAGERSSVPDWGSRIPNATEQVGAETSEPGTTTCVCTLQYKMLHKATRIQGSQINK